MSVRKGFRWALSCSIVDLEDYADLCLEVLIFLQAILSKDLALSCKTTRWQEPTSLFTSTHPLS